MMVICLLLMRESSQRLPVRVVACLRRTDATLNLSECSLHRGTRQAKVGSQLRKGCIWCSRSSAGDACVQPIRLQEFLLQRRGAGSRLPDPCEHCTVEVRGLSIHAPIQASANLATNPARLHLSDSGRCAEPTQQIDEDISAFPYEQPFATALAPMSAEMVSFGEPGKVARLTRRDIDLKVDAP
jgi:hypothetical protein